MNQLIIQPEGNNDTLYSFEQKDGKGILIINEKEIAKRIWDKYQSYAGRCTVIEKIAPLSYPDWLDKEYQCQS